MRYGMVIDLNRCTGCQACAMACKAQNGAPAGVWYSKVFESEVGEYPHCHVLFTPVLCMHCNNAPCVAACPVGATYKEENGIVAINRDKCIGCQLCIHACPYGARTYIDKIEPVNAEYGLTPYETMMYKDHVEGVVEKCNFCESELEKGEKPACVRTCVAYARFFGDLDDPESDPCQQLAKHPEAFQMTPEDGSDPAQYDPSVYYLPKVNLI